ncbi:tripartite tricarboxylate transporter substrate binding protein [Hydrogenophaga sp.]|uniref:Bug family tripartite tricarboxylate transporter substrate binding protein n=1 Tax=Hydrogenophaga sp. TaxID=1904254 RepID=UPI00271A6440|nr:tripartite tricarboxylate transporter substrate binding protein [Hydrogenophaga sp.]MDO9437592.1 tripartite tricarboxylate transporter substrate binding protein [Hydrogenophaga sp.]
MLKKCLGLAMAALSIAAHAQTDFPSRPIRLVVPFAPGGPTDGVARVVADDIGKRLGQTIAVENKAGATGVIGQDFVSKAPPDGHTIVAITSTSSNNYHLMGRPLDFYKDFAMIGRIYNTYTVLAINPKAPGMENIQNLQQLAAYIKAHPGALNYTSSGSGSLGHLTMEKVKLHFGLDIQHINYKGQAQAMQDVMAGRIPIISATFTIAPQILSGQLRGIAIGTPQPSPHLPQVGTFRSQGMPDLVSAVWVGLAAPPSTPKAIVDRWSDELRISLAKPEVASRLQAVVGTESEYLSASEFAAYATRDFAYWGAVIKEGGIKGE